MLKYWFVININQNFFLRVGNRIFECQVGKGGLKKSVNKIEGDKSTPKGTWQLKKIFYRSDKVLRPKIKNKIILKINKITRNCAWCDDISSHNYNKYVKINNLTSKNINHEKLWREDEAYDILIAISYNSKPTIKNKGSAIFIHCSFSDNRNTHGCIALKKTDLVFLIKNLRNDTYIKI